MNQQKAEKIKMRQSVFYITFKIRVLEEEIIQKVTYNIIYMYAESIQSVFVGKNLYV